MFRYFCDFRDDESGAVTVDWVVLTAAVVVLAAGFYFSIDEETSNLSNRIANKIGEQTVE